MVYGSNGNSHVFDDDGGDQPYCPMCEEEPVEYEGDLCHKCLYVKAKNTAMENYDMARNYLRDKPITEQRIGMTSWTDFVLRELHGIEDCHNPILLTELLEGFEKDSIFEDKSGKNFTVATAIAEYVTEDSYDFMQYIEEADNVKS